ncbi:MAG TPA: neutral zinc metallopeptidase [Candidatus Limnocylindria bacterium]|nr:neutral zinc metallopeptidase [Candidatus Limnocylindria bacterium]
MRLDEEQESRNVEDRRGHRISRGGMVGGGIGTIAIVLIALFFGVDPSILLQGVEETNVPQTSSPQPQGRGEEDEMRQFVARVLGSTERTWTKIFEAGGRTYEKPTLVLFSDAVQSACGFGQAASGPFYCGPDHKIYIDLSFYRDLRQRFDAPGDFAQAYVIAHEVGHHVQNLLGIMGKVQAAQSRAGEQQANALSVRLELQADCLAGVWANFAHRERNILEQGDIEEGLNAAAQIGDDRMQKRARGHVVPEAFTHGSAEQRVRWFRRGIESGDLNQCDTFAPGAV